MGNVQQQCVFESPVKQDKLSIVFYSYLLRQCHIGWKSQIFLPLFSFSAWHFL